MMNRIPTSALAAVLLLTAFSAAQTHPTSSWVIPQCGAYGPGGKAGIRIQNVTVGVVILEQVATTTMDIHLRNTSSRQREAEVLIPVPTGVVVRGFTFQGGGKEPTARVLPRDEAKATYAAIVAKIRDPALLEFAGYDLVRSSLFPVSAGGSQTVRLTYEHLLHADGNRIDYELPRSESLTYAVPWKVSVRIKSKRPVATVYSPSHNLDVHRSTPGIVSARIAGDAVREPGPFRLSFLLAGKGVTASLLAYPDAETGGGYFLLLAGLPPVSRDTEEVSPVRREVTLVLDRSGSMRGEKIEQVREAALQVLAGLEPGEAFNIIAYNDAVTPFAEKAMEKTGGTERRARAFLKSLKAEGGTNIHDALVEALHRPPPEGMLPLVLFLTDGLPTAGVTSEVAIRNVAMKRNPHRRRIFTFGVGVDVNTPLLEKIASETRAAPTFVLPGENVEAKVSRVFKRLSGPVLAEPVLRAVDSAGRPAPTRTRDCLPARLPDLFDGDRLVVLGRYTGETPLSFQLSGNFRNTRRAFCFTFDLDRASTRNAFVPRLWASRKIGVLVDALRQAGADAHVASASGKKPHPKWNELVEEVIHLSRKFGILTEYTAFLAREGVDLSQKDRILAEADRNFLNRAVAVRSGIGSVNQSLNSIGQQAQICQNSRNFYWDANLNRVEVTTVQQIADRAFFRKGKRWVDSRLLERKAPPDRVVRFGTEAFKALVHGLTGAGRQGCVSLKGEILLEVGGKSILVRQGDPR